MAVSWVLVVNAALLVGFGVGGIVGSALIVAAFLVGSLPARLLLPGWLVRLLLIFAVLGSGNDAIALMRGGSPVLGGMFSIAAGTVVSGLLRSRARRLSSHENRRPAKIVAAVAVSLAAGLGWLARWANGMPVWALFAIEGLASLAGLVLTIKRDRPARNGEPERDRQTPGSPSS